MESFFNSTSFELKILFFTILLCCLWWGFSWIYRYILSSMKLPSGYKRYEIVLKDKILPIKFTGRYRRDLETGNWHYYETTKGIVWHFRKENILGVYGDTIDTILKNKEK